MPHHVTYKHRYYDNGEIIEWKVDPKDLATRTVSWLKQITVSWLKGDDNFCHHFKEQMAEALGDKVKEMSNEAFLQEMGRRPRERLADLYCLQYNGTTLENEMSLADLALFVESTWTKSFVLKLIPSFA